MSKCIKSVEAPPKTEQEKTTAQNAEVHFSPLLKALRAHFEHYTGLTEPRPVADALRPQVDDL